VRHSNLMVGLAFLAALAPSGQQTGANTVDRLRCIAVEIALTRGIEAMEGTAFTEADGTTYTRGKTTGRVHALTPIEELQIAPMVDEMTQGAIEFADLWLIGPGSVGRSNERVLTDKAQEFNSLMLECLNAFGTEIAPQN
jgi:hypothetical protein